MLQSSKSELTRAQEEEEFKSFFSWRNNKQKIIVNCLCAIDATNSIKIPPKKTVDLIKLQ